MRVGLGIGMACLAATVASMAAWAQPTTPRVRSAQVIVARSRSYLGVGVAEITSERAKALNLKEERGAEVTRVEEDGPAAKAGMKEGDVVLEYNGQAVHGIDEFQRLIRETPPGRQVKMVVWRNGAPQTLTVMVGERKGMAMSGDDGAWSFTMPPMPPMTPMPDIEIPSFRMTYQNPMLGIDGEALGPQEQLADFFGVKDGVLVKVVKKNSPADKAGLKAGDVIVKVDDSKITTTSEITRALRNLRSKRNFTVTVVRNKKEMPLPVTMEDRGSIIKAGIRTVQC
jgi:serine protease Do